MLVVLHIYIYFETPRVPAQGHSRASQNLKTLEAHAKRKKGKHGNNLAKNFCKGKKNI